MYLIQEDGPFRSLYNDEIHKRLNDRLIVDKMRLNSMRCLIKERWKNRCVSHGMLNIDAKRIFIQVRKEMNNLIIDYKHNYTKNYLIGLGTNENKDSSFRKATQRFKRSFIQVLSTKNA